MVKKILLGLLILIVLIQFFRPEQNVSAEQPAPLKEAYAIPEDVQGILQKACDDCHSNSTVYPWYANIQPVGWWMNSHIEDGKRHLNFDEFTNLPLARQNHKFEEFVEMIEEGEMPLESYTQLGMHQEANLTEAEKGKLIDWAKSQMAMLKSTYPADSLIMKRRNH
ncbi:hypothetical protein GCM10007049_30190 [Echinicola pacifica]|uniref:Haem-binding domain-containing protein n=1 Tax=Echinicola pacifica TaxID=346377 RepID=A0A918Q5S1_9BACT|nr:heme-binding domain-containing protein [Echinicola pacifica]GGZ34759.1 hypothetical protein GCM10007049_30190 [Echinicola pacifica]